MKKVTIIFKNKKKFVVYIDEMDKFDKLYAELQVAIDDKKEFLKFYNLILPVKDIYMIKCENYK